VAADTLLAISSQSVGGVLNQTSVQSLLPLPMTVMDFYRLIPASRFRTMGFVEALPAWKVSEQRISSETVWTRLAAHDGPQTL
jgi:hypothetical protein